MQEISSTITRTCPQMGVNGAETRTRQRRKLERQNGRHRDVRSTRILSEASLTSTNSEYLYIVERTQSGAQVGAKCHVQSRTFQFADVRGLDDLLDLVYEGFA